MRHSTYVIASTPRSGSSLLSEGLEATGVAGRPAEVFAPAFRGMWQTHWSLADDSTFDDFLHAALGYGTTANGVYGVKIHWGQIRPLAAQLAVSGDPGQVLNALYPGAAFVNIVRRDRRAQALSLFRAMATNEWCRFVGGSIAPTDPPALALDHGEVRKLESAIHAHQAAWTRHFQTFGIVPLTVEYERLDRDYRGQIGRVLEFLGADPSYAAKIPPARLIRQSDGLNARWRQAMDDTDAILEEQTT